MYKSRTVTVRLAENEIRRLDDLCKGQLTRSKIIQLLVNDFLEKAEKDQVDFIVKKLFGPSRVK
jgi:metal-responsive CopG/Arc/MetJ family transcriptional regulator